MDIVGIGNLIGKGLDKFIPDADTKVKAKLAIEQMIVQGEFNTLMKQIEVNLQDAKSKSMFQAGWRPWMGWCCGFAVFYHFLVFPLLGPVIEVWWGVELVDLEWEELAALTAGLLGIYKMRSNERIAGAA